MPSSRKVTFGASVEAPPRYTSRTESESESDSTQSPLPAYKPGSTYETTTRETTSTYSTQDPGNGMEEPDLEAQKSSRSRPSSEPVLISEMTVVTTTVQEIPAKSLWLRRVGIALCFFIIVGSVVTIALQMTGHND